jgi:hypothetical protein
MDYLKKRSLFKIEMMGTGGIQPQILSWRTKAGNSQLSHKALE